MAHHASGADCLTGIMKNMYQEHRPPPRLAPFVECFWTLRATEDIRDYPVLPDGCADIVYTRGAGWSGPRLVGTMTRTQSFSVKAGQFHCGVRFRPGMSTSFLPNPAAGTIDQSIPLAELWGQRVRSLGTQLDDTREPDQCVALFEAELVNPAAPGIAQQIAAYIVNHAGKIRVDNLAFEAGMSARQLRRVFIEQVGLSPKHFCRVIRFRHSVSQLAERPRGDWTQLALDCGYYDQAHFINEFRELSGYSPGEFLSRPR